MATKTKAATKTAAEATGIIERSKEIKIDSVLANIGKAQTAATGALADIQRELIERMGDLQTINAAIELREADIETLHGKDAVLMSLDDLNTKLATERQNFTVALAQARAEYERAMADLTTQRQREVAEYGYKLKQDRQAEADTYKRGVEDRNRQEQLRQAEFDRRLAEAEADLAGRKQKIAEAEQLLATFDARVEAVAKEKADAQVRQIKMALDHQAKLDAVTNQAALRQAESDAARARADLEKAEREIAALKAQLSMAYEKQSELAGKVADAATMKTAQAESLALMTNIGGGNGATRARG